MGQVPRQPYSNLLRHHANIDRSDGTTTDDAAYPAQPRAPTPSRNRPAISTSPARTSVTALRADPRLRHPERRLDRRRHQLEQRPDLAAADAKLANVGSDAFPVGQLTWNSGAHEWGSTSPIFRTHPDSDLSFVLIRERAQQHRR
jgi:hypothetical protein